MEITFDDNKDCDSYKNYVEKPDDRGYIKQFNKIFGQNNLAPALRIHERLKNSKNASFYNLTFAGPKNKIEKKDGCRDNEEQVLKVRIGDAYRKFFYYKQIIEGEISFCLTKDWSGQFEQITDIHVFDINKHVYKK